MTPRYLMMGMLALAGCDKPKVSQVTATPPAANPAKDQFAGREIIVGTKHIKAGATSKEVYDLLGVPLARTSIDGVGLKTVEELTYADGAGTRVLIFEDDRLVRWKYQFNR